MHFTIKKAFGDKIIVEQGNNLPRIYDGITEMVTDMFFDKIKNEFSGAELEVVVDFTFNPPKAL